MNLWVHNEALQRILCSRCHPELDRQPLVGLGERGQLGLQRDVRGVGFLECHGVVRLVCVIPVFACSLQLGKLVQRLCNLFLGLVLDLDSGQFALERVGDGLLAGMRRLAVLLGVLPQCHQLLLELRPKPPEHPVAGASLFELHLNCGIRRKLLLEFRNLGLSSAELGTSGRHRLGLRSHRLPQPVPRLGLARNLGLQELDPHIVLGRLDPKVSGLRLGFGLRVPEAVELRLHRVDQLAAMFYLDLTRRRRRCRLNLFGLCSVGQVVQLLPDKLDLDRRRLIVGLRRLELLLDRPELQLRVLAVGNRSLQRSVCLIRRGLVVGDGRPQRCVGFAQGGNLGLDRHKLL
mmetsp:Transcript_30541/g.91556  ORF Transcript_30541/g.91556 Transcript_30541/m.91556 type:complete len:347 (+) Transcript_30541:16-1056(+)